MVRVLSTISLFFKTRGSYGLKLLLAMMIINLPNVVLANLSWWGILAKVFPTTLGRTAQEIYIDPGALSWVYGAMLVFWLLNWQKISRYCTLIYTGFVTSSLLINVSGLIFTLFRPEQSGTRLLLDGALVWISNILIFMMWYWLLDGGGSEKRQTNLSCRRDFAFLQQVNSYPGWEDWRPRLLDYLFLAFLTSTNFAPADVIVLSRRAKCLMMLQVGLALIIIAMLASRAINILR